MKSLIQILLLNFLSIQVFGQDTIRYDILNNEVPNPYWYEYSNKDNTLKIASGISFAAGGTLFAIGFIRAGANSVDEGMAVAASAFVNINGVLLTELGSYALQQQLPAWDLVEPGDFYSKDPRSIKPYIISGSVFLGLGVILTLIDENAGPINKRNSKKLYRMLRASSSRDGVGVTYEF